eukprot:2270964-Rhodomonas_salina.3
MLLGVPTMSYTTMKIQIFCARSISDLSFVVLFRVKFKLLSTTMKIQIFCARARSISGRNSYPPPGTNLSFVELFRFNPASII